MRIGMGYDVHKLVPNRDLILGGVKIPHELGLLGHSDADVLLHSIMDALLGAAALGDIGKHFPDTDPAYKGADSVKLLEHVGRLIREAGYSIENIDATIIAQRPKMRPHIDTMRRNIKEALGIEVDQINVKATTGNLFITVKGMKNDAGSKIIVAPCLRGHKTVYGLLFCPKGPGQQALY